MTQRIVRACRFVAAVAFGVAVLLLPADPPSVAAVPAAIVSVVAATVSFLLPSGLLRKSDRLSAGAPSNDP